MTFSRLLTATIATCMLLGGCSRASTRAVPARPEGALARATVEQGTLQGIKSGSVHAFLGVPFAAAPVGTLRWRAPQPATRWTGVRQAQQFGANCQQTPPPGNKYRAWTSEYLPSGSFSEDCLYLNVWTPAPRAGGMLPVLVWIHGGGFVSGSGDVPIYEGARLAQQGIIVVTLNYRLGVFGLLAHPQLQAEGGSSSGNYWLQDQIAALQWVQRNINAFGGNPARITIAGQSSGAVSVHSLILSPKAKGLFARAIAQSGSGLHLLGSWPQPEAQLAAGERMTRAAGVDVEQLRAMASDDVMRVAGQHAATAQLHFVPVADDSLIPRRPDDAVATGSYNDSPLLTGITADEGSSMFTDYRPSTYKEYRESVEKYYGAFSSQLLELYSSADPAIAAAQLARDRDIVSMLLWTEKRRARSSHPVYAYLFAHVEPGPECALYGSFHSSEIPYIFGTLGKATNRTFTKVDYSLSATMSQYWVNFVSSGNPNGETLPHLPHWPSFDTNARLMVFGDVAKASSVVTEERMWTWREYFQAGGK